MTLQVLNTRLVRGPCLPSLLQSLPGHTLHPRSHACVKMKVISSPISQTQADSQYLQLVSSFVLKKKGLQDKINRTQNKDRHGYTHTTYILDPTVV